MKRYYTWIMLAGVLAASGCGLVERGGPDGSGTIECTQVLVAPQVGGRIASLPLQEGAVVSKGDLVAQIDSRDYELRRDEAAAAARAAEADFKRIKQVFEQKSVTQKQLDDAQAGVDLARARLALAEKAVADCRVTAPMDGVVTTKSREEGEVISVGTPVVQLSRLDEVWLSVYVPESHLARVKLGQPARVKVDGDKRFFEGLVTFISPEAEFTPRNVQTPDERAKLVYRVKITLKNPKGIFKPGMPADGYLTE
ncbi:MAG TPA: efflux RND transporter periplasmic adaptor subunit [Kiritimatiellia bacterium]|nr:efflux RND transporter periplasmic adaptor subunit [Kiritimatiellia bacterium]